MGCRSDKDGSLNGQQSTATQCEIISSKVVDGARKNITMSILQSRKPEFKLCMLVCINCHKTHSLIIRYSSTKKGTKKEQCLKQHTFSFASVVLHQFLSTSLANYSFLSQQLHYFGISFLFVVICKRSTHYFVTGFPSLKPNETDSHKQAM